MALKSEKAKLEIARDYYRQIYKTDISAIDGVKRNPELARILHYADDTGLEADAVYQSENGKYALIDIKLGTNKIAEAEKGLLKFREVIRKHNDEARKDPGHPKTVYREPSALVIICATATMGYTTVNGVKVVPVDCPIHVYNEVYIKPLKLSHGLKQMKNV